MTLFPFPDLEKECAEEPPRQYTEEKKEIRRETTEYHGFPPISHAVSVSYHTYHPPFAPYPPLTGPAEINATHLMPVRVEEQPKNATVFFNPKLPLHNLLIFNLSLSQELNALMRQKAREGDAYATRALIHQCADVDSKDEVFCNFC